MWDGVLDDTEFVLSDRLEECLGFLCSLPSEVSDLAGFIAL